MHLQELVISTMLQAQWMGQYSSAMQECQLLHGQLQVGGLVPGFTLKSHLAISARLVLLSQLFPSGSAEASGHQVLC